MRLAAAVAPGRSIARAVDRARLAEKNGYDSVLMSQLPNERDTSLVLAAYAAVEGACDVFRGRFERYASLPYYRSMLNASGFGDRLDRGEISDAMLHELAGLGDERAVREAVRRYRDAGCTLPLVGPFAEHDGAAGFEASLEAAIA